MTRESIRGSVSMAGRSASMATMGYLQQPLVWNEVKGGPANFSPTKKTDMLCKLSHYYIYFTNFTYGHFPDRQHYFAAAGENRDIRSLWMGPFFIGRIMFFSTFGGCPMFQNF